MSLSGNQIRLSVAAFALGAALAGPTALGVAHADTRADSESGSAAATDSASRGPSTARADRANGGARGSKAATAGAAAATSRPRVSGAAPRPMPEPAPKQETAAASTTATANANTSAGAQAAAAPPPPDLTYNSTIPTPYGGVGQWMINKDNQIADWIGTPQPVNGSLKTILEGINVVMVDTASTTAAQSVRNLNAWMARAGFGASAVSSTGYQGAFGPNPGPVILGQQPTGASQAFRDSFFLFANSHARAFGPYPNAGGPGFVWTASLSEENWTITNPLTHGYESFDNARNQLRDGMVAAGAEYVADLFMDNVYNEDIYSTGDADGFAVVIELNSILKAAKTPRGYAVGPKG